MTTIAFLNDAPTEVILSAGHKRSRVQVAKTGNFQDPRYGKFKITTGDFDKWEANFNALSKADDHLGLPVDVDHKPEKMGETEAVGWVVSLDRKGKSGTGSTPNELWAVVEWNTLGVELVGDRRYAYISPSYQHDFKDETGRAHGTALVGVALTNRPFLSMATVSLSAAMSLATEDEEAPYSPEQMTTLLDSMRKGLGLADDADEATVLAAFQKSQEKPAPVAATLDGVNLSDVAAAQGMVLLSSADHLKLAADAAAGATAAKELHQTKFDNAWTSAVGGGAVLPAMKETFQLSYNVDADATIKTLSELPRNSSAHVDAEGHTGDPESGAVSETTLSEARAEGWRVDTDRAAIDTQIQTLMASENIDYDTAFERVLAGV